MEMREPRRHVVMCAAACHPDLGSEFAVGWQWVTAAAQRHRVTVITGDANGSRDAIRHRLTVEPQLGRNIEFRFLPWFDPPQSPLLERLWVAVPPIYYRYYRAWLRHAAEEIRRIIHDEHVDLVHHVTYICFREPGFAAELGVPFVWGPIGGTQNVPWAFLPSLGFYDGIRHGVRNVLNWIDLHLRRNVGRQIRIAAGLATVASDTQHEIKRLFGRSSVVIPATSCENSDSPPRRLGGDGPVRFVFSGVHIARKGLPFALHALGRLKHLPWSLDVLGTGPLTEAWRRRAEQLGIASRVCFRGFLPRSEAVRVMGNADAFVFPSLQEGWPTVVIEALSLGMPVVTTCLHGMADMIDETCGFPLKVETPAQLVADLTEALRTLATDQYALQRLSAGARLRADLFAREKQIDAINTLYEEVIATPGNR